jgi:predicted transposase YbfD/YdcC
MSVKPDLSRLLDDLAKPMDLRVISSPPSNVGLSLLTHFAALKDPRVKRTRRHELSDILVIAFCAVLGGADSWCAVETFGKAKLEWFNRFLKLPNGIPSHDTFSRVFAALDPIAFQNCFTAWINAVTIPLGLKRYQIDGKSLRGTNEGLGCLHTVSVWADEIGISLGQVKVADKSNEITAIPQLLSMLDLHGAIVSIDAMGCQKEIAKGVRDQGGDYLFAVKENQPTLYADVVACIDKGLAEDFKGLKHGVLVTEEASHGRQETRTYTVIYDPPGLSTKADWDGLKAVMSVSRRRVVDGVESDEMVYYISSSTCGIKLLAESVRCHWGIENGCHWILDVVFGEDGCRSRAGHAAENLAWIRRMALSLLKQDKSKGSIKGKRQRAGWDNSFLEHLLSLLAVPAQSEDA